MNNVLDKSFQSHDHDHSEKILSDQDNKILILDPEEYPGGIAIWGALPAVFNSSICPDEDNGVHVHARISIGGPKQIDQTFDTVRVKLKNQSGELGNFDISGSDTAHYNISTIFKKNLKYLLCPSCGKVHSDTGYLCVTYHLVHQCEHCGHFFEDTEPSISSAVMLLKEMCGDILQERPIIDPVERVFNAQTKQFSGGIQIWGSNPAVLWTSPKLEEGGIHFHGFLSKRTTPTVDETFGILTINGVLLDPEMVRHFMAQNGLKYLKQYIASLTCPNCGYLHFDMFDNAISPHLIHTCESCHSHFVAPDGQPHVSNPFLTIAESFLN